MHYHTLVHPLPRPIRWVLFALFASSTVSCSSGSRVSSRSVAPRPSAVSPEASAERPKLPTWVAHDGAYEIVARDVRVIAAVQPMIEREYETYRAIHGASPRRVQFFITESGEARAGDAASMPLADWMERVVIDVSAFASRPQVGPWIAPRSNAEGRP